MNSIWLGPFCYVCIVIFCIDKFNFFQAAQFANRCIKIEHPVLNLGT